MPDSASSMRTPPAVSSPRALRFGHTPDADDAFMFYGFVSGQVAIPGYTLIHELTTIDVLNTRARSDDPYELTAVSVHAFFALRERYQMLGIGTSVGRGYGPRLISLTAPPASSLAGKRIALPGAWTTATLAARVLLPAFTEVQMPFDQITPAILRGDVDAGVIIHEVQLTIEQQGLHLILDLGAAFAERNGGLPLPLGVNCVRKDLDEDLKQAIAKAFKRSIEIAFEQRSDALAYSAQYGRGASIELLDRFVGMYVNDDCLALSPDVERAIAALEVGFRLTQR